MWAETWVSGLPEKLLEAKIFLVYYNSLTDFCESLSLAVSRWLRNMRDTGKYCQPDPVVSPTCLQLLGLMCGRSSENNYSTTLWSERWLVRGQAAYSEHWFKSGPSLDWPEVPSICRCMAVTSDTSHRQLFSSWLLHACFSCPHYCDFIGNLELGQKRAHGVYFACSKGKVCVWGISIPVLTLLCAPGSSKAGKFEEGLALYCRDQGWFLLWPWQEILSEYSSSQHLSCKISQ